MAKRMNKVRALTGGLAAIMLMSNMAAMTTFAAEPTTAAGEPVVREDAGVESLSATDMDAKMELNPVVREDAAEMENASVQNDDTAKIAAQAANEQEAQPEANEQEAQPEEGVLEEVTVVRKEERKIRGITETAEHMSDGTVYFYITDENGETTLLDIKTEAELNQYPRWGDVFGQYRDITNALIGSDVEVKEIAAARAALVQKNGDCNVTIERVQSDSRDQVAILMSDGSLAFAHTNKNGEIEVYAIFSKEEGAQSDEMNLFQRGDELRKIAEEKEAQERALEQAKKQESLDKIATMDLFELMDYWNKISSVDQSLANGTYQYDEENATEEEKSIRDTLETLGMDIVKEAVGKGIEKAIESVPGGEFVGGPVKNLIMNAAGLQEEEPDLVKAINDQTKILEAKLDDVFKKLKEGSTNAVTAGLYGQILNS